MSKITVFILVTCALSLVSLTRPCEAFPVAGYVPLSDDKNHRIHQLPDKPKDPSLEDIQKNFSINIEGLSDSLELTIDSEAVRQALVESIFRCPEGLEYKFDACRLVE